MTKQNPIEGSVMAAHFDADGELIAVVGTDDKGVERVASLKDVASMHDEPLELKELHFIKPFEVIRYRDGQGAVRMKVHHWTCKNIP